MPPRKIKKDPEAVKLAKEIVDPIAALINDLEVKLEEVRQKIVKDETARILSAIREEYRNMPIMEFINGDFSAAGIFKKLGDEEFKEEEEEAEEEMEQVEELEEGEIIDQETENEIPDDAARDMSIPIVNSGQNSGRTTATDASLRELITPAGHVLPVPSTIHPKIDNLKNPRLPRHDEEIAFSLNGSPMVLSGSRRMTGLVVPKIEEPGTPV